MELDDDVCLCFRVSKRKILNFCRQERPTVASRISECQSAGTGCGWCVPYLKHLFEQYEAGSPDPDVSMPTAEYADQRGRFRRTGRRSTDPNPDD